MAEYGSEDTDVKTPAITSANDCLRADLISNTEARRNVVEILLNAHCCAIGSITSDADCAEIEVRKSPLPPAIYCFREVDFPAHAKIQCEVRRCAPRILRVGE